MTIKIEHVISANISTLKRLLVRQYKILEDWNYERSGDTTWVISNIQALEWALTVLADEEIQDVIQDWSQLWVKDETSS